MECKISESSPEPRWQRAIETNFQRQLSHKTNIMGAMPLSQDRMFGNEVGGITSVQEHASEETQLPDSI